MFNVITMVERNPKAVVACLVSFVLGMLAAYPLGWWLPESVAALLGAMVGAAAAVGGAFWVADSQGRARRRELGIAFVALVTPLRDSALTTIGYFEQPKSVRAQQDLDYKAAYSFWTDCETFGERMNHRFKLPLAELGIEGMARLAELENAVGALGNMVDPGFGDGVDPNLAADKYLHAARLILQKANNAIEHFS